MIPFRRRLIYYPLKIFFTLLYNQMAWTYDLVAAAVSFGSWNHWILSVLPYLHGPRILELGHGPGHLQLALLKESGDYSQVFGLDRSRSMGKIARRRLHRHGFSPDLIQGDGQALPFADGSLHQVVATFPTEYISRPVTLSEVWRVLAPGGQFIVLVSSYITGRKPEERALAWLFHITGQAPEWDDRALEPLQNAGFQAHVEWLAYGSSQLLLLFAKKRGKHEEPQISSGPHLSK